MHTIVRYEEQGAADLGQVERLRAIRWADVLHHHGPGLGPVALPELLPMRTVVGGQEKGLLHVGEAVDVVQGCGSCWVNVLDHAGPSLRPITLPELRPMHAVVALEEQGPAHWCESG